MKNRILLIVFFFFNGLYGFGQESKSDLNDLSRLSIEELSQLKSKYKATDMEKVIMLAIEAASHKPLPLRKAPSIISVITDEEIEKSGARDLMDIILMIPGMEFNVDVEGVVALSFRGLWANEGSISMQIDGQEINEIAYASLQFGNHHQISQIKKIEIIRGPGSAMYGGCAEYAVINIVTKKGSDIKGVSANLILGQTAETYSKQNIGVAAGNQINDFSYQVSGILGRGQRSDRNYTDVYGNSYSMIGSSDMNPSGVNAGIKYKNLSLNFLYDNYQTTTRDELITILSKAYPLDFLTCMTQLKYSGQITKKIQLQVRLENKYAEPWRFVGTPEPVDSLYTGYRLKANTYRAHVSTLFDPLYWLNLNVGAETNIDHGRIVLGELFRTDSTDQIRYLNFATFVQGLIKTSVANFTVGARYDVSSAFGSAFNPRLGATKRFGIFNFKFLYASSFRAPAIESIQLGMDKVRLKPQRSNTMEFEASVKLGKDMYLSVNVFDINTTDAIRYFAKTDTPIIGHPDGYRNSRVAIGSKGLELEYKYKSDFGFINVIYSNYSVGNKGVDRSNNVPQDRTQTLGVAKNKLTVTGCYNITPKIYLSPSINVLGKRWGTTGVDSNNRGVFSEFKPQTTLNIFAGSSTLVRNLTAGIGIRNILNEDIIYLQAYNSLHAPLPGMGREYYLKVNYLIPFKKKDK